MVIVVGNNDSSIHYPSSSSYNAQQNSGLLKVHLRSVRTPLASRPVRWEESLTRTFLQKFPLRNARAARGRWILQLLYLAFFCLIFLRLSESIFVCVCFFCVCLYVWVLVFVFQLFPNESWLNYFLLWLKSATREYPITYYSHFL